MSMPCERRADALQQFINDRGFPPHLLSAPAPLQQVYADLGYREGIYRWRKRCRAGFSRCDLSGVNRRAGGLRGRHDPPVLQAIGRDSRSVTVADKASQRVERAPCAWWTARQRRYEAEEGTSAHPRASRRVQLHLQHLLILGHVTSAFGFDHAASRQTPAPVILRRGRPRSSGCLRRDLRHTEATRACRMAGEGIDRCNPGPDGVRFAEDVHGFLPIRICAPSVCSAQ